jgi:hypothetical protein
MPRSQSFPALDSAELDATRGKEHLASHGDREECHPTVVVFERGRNRVSAVDREKGERSDGEFSAP